MNKNKSGKALAVFFVCLVIIIVLPVSVFIGARKMMNYKLNGLKVQCEVTEVIERVNGPQQVRVVYTNENGVTLGANAVMNRRVSVGDKAEGYVLREKPFDVYVMPSGELIAVFCLIFGLVIIAAFVGLFLGLRAYREHRLLVSRGVLTKGKLLFVQETGKFVYNTQVSFRDSDGEEQIFPYVFTKVVPSQDKEYNVVYFKKKNGRVVSELIEL